MSLLINILEKYIFSGLPSSAAWDLMKYAWGKIQDESWEDLYISSFMLAVKDAKPYLEKYGDINKEISLDDTALRKAFNRDLALDITSIPFSTLNDDQFAKQLGKDMADRFVLTIGGNNLSSDDYSQIIYNLIARAREKFRSSITRNENAFRQAILSESISLQKQLLTTKSTIDDSHLTVKEIKKQVVLLSEYVEELVKENRKLQKEQHSELSDDELREIEVGYLNRICSRFDEWDIYFIPFGAVSKESQWNTEPMPERSRKRRHQYPEFSNLTGESIDNKPLYWKDIHNATDKYKSFVLLGDPGCGKTTFLERLCLEISRSSLESRSGQLPILLTMNKYRPELSLHDFIVETFGVHELATRLPNYLDEGRLCLIFDGINEIPKNSRDNLVLQIQNLENQWEAKGNRFIISCRRLDYDNSIKEMPTVIIESLTNEQIQLFIKTEMPNNWNNLWAVLQKPNMLGIFDLAKNPYLLTMIIDIHAAYTDEFPQNRSAIIEKFVHTLVEREKIKNTILFGLSTEAIYFALATLAFKMHEINGAGSSVDLKTAIEYIPLEMSSLNNVQKTFINPHLVLDLGICANLLWVSPDRSIVRFSHQLLHEFFTACELKRLFELNGKLHNYWMNGWWELSGWEESFVLLVGLSSNAPNIIEWLQSYHPPLSARCIVEGGQSIDNKHIHKIQSILDITLQDGKVPATGRIDAGIQLGHIGDNRQGIVRCLDIEWCEIPSGRFLMGADLNSMDLHIFKISKYPITYAQFQEFVFDGGYKNNYFWSQNGWKWKSQTKCDSPDDSWFKEFNLPNMPRTGISWFEAVAFANWFSGKFKQDVSLPSEAEWEKAARGLDGRLFSWGNEFIEDNCNSILLDHGLAPVGCFPKGRSPFGVEDMCGNIWEWCITAFAKDWQNPQSRFTLPYRLDERDSLELGLNATRVVKGGSYLRSKSSIVCFERSGYYQGYKNSDLGFRLAKYE